MSEVTSRPSVKSVSPEAVSESALLLGVAAVVFTGKVLFDAIARTSPRLRERAQQRKVPADALSALDAHKVRTIKALDLAAYVLSADALVEPLRAVVEAPTIAAAEKAGSALMEAATEAHVRTLVATVAVACQRSSEDVGFHQTTIDRPHAGRAARIVATTASGRALVSEVHASSDGRVSVETEVVGVHDGSCHGLLDAFDEALARRGIHGNKSRRFTGGICELVSARSVAPTLAKSRRQTQPTATTPSRQQRRDLSQSTVRSKR